nr:MAG TPA: hypothetical protein [Caudoviricetes sp.]
MSKTGSYIFLSANNNRRFYLLFAVNVSQNVSQKSAIIKQKIPGLSCDSSGISFILASYRQVTGKLNHFAAST